METPPTMSRQTPFWLRESAGQPARGCLARDRCPLWLQPVILGLMWVLILCPALAAATTRPYYRRPSPRAFNAADFSHDRYPLHLSPSNEVRLPSYVDGPFNLSAYSDRFDARAAAVVSSSVGITNLMGFGSDLLELSEYKGWAPGVLVPKLRWLAEMAYLDFFPGQFGSEWMWVSEVIPHCKPGWVGTFGPGVDELALVGDWPEGNYDMAQMHLLMMAYRYYDELTPQAREHLINELLQKGTLHRPGHDDTHTSGSVPVDWERAGTVEVPIIGTDITQIGETENHILMILTARYLSNQLLFQRTRQQVHDNRRNGSNGGPGCTDLVLSLLRNILRGDFSEYNSKNYQKETRWALLNLYNYAYDHEVRLSARMVLDYLSARFATTSSDLRRMVPFRRQNASPKNRTMGGENSGFMEVGLLEHQLGADVMTRLFILLTGNTRALGSPNPELVPGTQFAMRPWAWALADTGDDFLIDMLSDYRLPAPIHQLFVNDLHRRFFQRLHRRPQAGEQGGNRNVDNMEINAGSPSYLITAGGRAAEQAISGFLIFGYKDVDKGVAVPTSFMPTGESAGPGTQNSARDLIQFGSFSQEPDEVANYGVAPDFACGHRIYLPPWVQGEREGGFLFVNKRPTSPSDVNRPGFYLAIYQQPDGLSLMEAFDTWLHPELDFRQFKDGVLQRNPGLQLQSNVEARYTTQNGNRIRFVIWNDGEREDIDAGAQVLGVEYGSGDPADAIGDAGSATGRLVNGTVLNTPAEAVVEISNPVHGGTITLDLSDKWHPKRIDENGSVEQAGFNNEVWVDFGAPGPGEGDAFRPFNTLTAAAGAVAAGGVIKILPGTSQETLLIAQKRMRIEAPLGGVLIGAQTGPRWVLRAPKGPPPRFGHSMVYDSLRRMTVLFGGRTNWGGITPFNDLWEWDGLRWIQRMENSVSNGWSFFPQFGWRPGTQGQPARRAHASMAYDSRRGRVVLFGGQALAPDGTVFALKDLWEWDGAEWRFRGTNGPVARQFASMAYDERRGRTVLFGGQSVPSPGETVDHGWIWEWDGDRWHVKKPTPVPSNGTPGAMTYDSARGVAVWGPAFESHSFWSFWDWDGDKWSIFPVVHFTDPIVTLFHGTTSGAFGYDRELERSVWFGGQHGAVHNQTGFFDGRNWTLLTNNTPPPAPRVLSAMAYDTHRRAMVLFGGSSGQASGQNGTNDTWELVTKGAPLVNTQPISGTSVKLGGGGPASQSGDTGSLQIYAAAGQTRLIWSPAEGRTLESSESVLGPWKTVRNAINPYPVSAADRSRFYRVRFTPP